jgi:hypothetical protein
MAERKEDDTNNLFRIPGDLGLPSPSPDKYYIVVQEDGPRRGEILIKRKGGGDQTIGIIPVDNSFRSTNIASH